MAIYFGFVHSRLGFEAWDPSTTLVLGVAITTAGWLAVTFMTPPVDADTLRALLGAGGDPDLSVPTAAQIADQFGMPEMKTVLDEAR